MAGVGEAGPRNASDTFGDRDADARPSTTKHGKGSAKNTPQSDLGKHLGKQQPATAKAIKDPSAPRNAPASGAAGIGPGAAVSTLPPLNGKSEEQAVQKLGELCRLEAFKGLSDSDKQAIFGYLRNHFERIDAVILTLQKADTGKDNLAKDTLMARARLEHKQAQILTKLPSENERDRIRNQIARIWAIAEDTNGFDSAGFRKSLANECRTDYTLRGIYAAYFDKYINRTKSATFDVKYVASKTCHAGAGQLCLRSISVTRLKVGWPSIIIRRPRKLSQR